MILQMLVEETLQHNNELDYNEKSFQRAFRKTSSFLLSDTLHVRYLTLLVGLKSETDEITIEDNIKIRRLNIEELERLLNSKYISILSAFRYAPFKISYCIEIIYEIDKYVENDENWKQEFFSQLATTEKTVKRVLSALRLIKYSNIDALCTLCELVELPFGISWHEKQTLSCVIF